MPKKTERKQKSWAQIDIKIHQGNPQTHINESIDINHPQKTQGNPHQSQKNHHRNGWFRHPATQRRRGIVIARLHQWSLGALPGADGVGALRRELGAADAGEAAGALLDDAAACARAPGGTTKWLVS